MYKKFNLFLVLVLGLAANLAAQEATLSTKTAPTANYPKQMWEIGVHGGHAIVLGDVSPRPGFGFGFHVRRALDYPLSLRLDAVFNRTYGLEQRNTGGAAGPSATISPINSVSMYNFGATGAAYHANYRNTYLATSLQLLYSLNNWNYKKSLSKYNVYVYMGAGFNAFNVKTNALNGSALYNWPTATTAQKDLKALMDKTYETSVDLYSPHDTKVSVGSDDIRTFQFHGQGGVGFSFKVTPKFNIGIDHNVTLVFGNNGDMLDGYRLKSPGGQGVAAPETQYRDLLHYTSVRFNFNIGKSSNRTEPLYWASPMDILNDDVAELKARPKFDPTDSDADGVIDMFDQEKESPAGAAVDTRGITLDSDKDGFPDYKDKEIYSPPGYKIDNAGIAQVPKPNYVSEPDVVKIVDTKIASIKCDPCSCLDEWFFPIVHFDYDKSFIKKAEFDKLQNVATVMQTCDNRKIVVTGYTDGANSARGNAIACKRASETIDYMMKKYGFSRDRFILNYSEAQLVNTKAKEYVNRRVEFRTAKPTDVDMDCGGINVKGTKNYSGNKDAGY